jgi:hypothetical protein
MMGDGVSLRGRDVLENARRDVVLANQRAQTSWWSGAPSLAAYVKEAASVKARASDRDEVAKEESFHVPAQLYSCINKL